MATYPTTLPILKQYRWPEAVSHMSKYIAKSSGDLQSEEPGDVAQAPTASWHDQR